MKRLLLSIVFFSIYLSSFSSTIISGTIKNTKCSFVNLTYMGSCTVTSPNYYGEKRYSAEIKNGSFRLNIGTSPDYSIFILELPDDTVNIQLLIKKDDSIHIEADVKNLTKTFIASGIGCSMTNYLFALRFLKTYSNTDIKPQEIISFEKQLKNEELFFLKAFQSKISSHVPGLTSDENVTINRLKDVSILTDNEYKLLENRTNYFIVRAIDKTPFEYLIKNLDKYLELFSNIDFSKNFIINDYVTDNLTAYYALLSCYKKAVTKGTISKNELQTYLSENRVTETASLLSEELRQKELSDLFYNDLLVGRDQRYIANKKLINTVPYNKKLEIYYNNYLNGLANSEFQLSANTCNLDDTTEVKLFNSLKGENVYLILWDIDSSPSLIPIFELSTINLLKAKYANAIYFLDICIADESQKQQWASLIVNHNWKGHHYFYDTNKSKKIINKFNYENALRSCSGQKYYLIDKSGNIVNSSETPLINID